MQHAQGGAIKLETESYGEQRLGEDLAFVRMVISLVVAWVVCCHGYKARCNPCVQNEPSPVNNRPRYRRSSPRCSSLEYY
jgi:hypothetical protein